MVSQSNINFLPFYQILKVTPPPSPTKKYNNNLPESNSPSKITTDGHYSWNQMGANTCK